MYNGIGNDDESEPKHKIFANHTKADQKEMGAKDREIEL